MVSWLALLVALALPQLVGTIGAYFTAQSVRSWYPRLHKPSWRPPSKVFDPVWISLYVCMGTASYLVWVDGMHTIALALYAVQLVLNGLWSPLFFGLRSPLAGLIDIILLWCAILLTVVAFFPISVWAGILLLPYLLWVTFATALNYTIWRMN